MSAFFQSLEAAQREEAECLKRERPELHKLDAENPLHAAWTDGYRLGLRDRNRPDGHALAINPHPQSAKPESAQ